MALACRYLFFLIYISTKSEAQLTGQEKYVRARVWPSSGKPSHDWIPRECTDSIQDGGGQGALLLLFRPDTASAQQAASMHNEWCPCLQNRPTG